VQALASESQDKAKFARVQSYQTCAT
jgi:hypothetical protein